MQNRQNRDRLTLENIEDSEWKSRNQDPMISLAIDRACLGLALGKGDRSVGTSQKVSTQPD